MEASILGKKTEGRPKRMLFDWIMKTDVKNSHTNLTQNRTERAGKAQRGMKTAEP